MSDGGTVNRSEVATMANGTRALVQGGYSTNTGQQVRYGYMSYTIHAFTLASTGNATDDLQSIEELVEHGGASGT